MQAAINVHLAQERREIVHAMETLQSSYRGSDPNIGDRDFLIKARGVVGDSLPYLVSAVGSCRIGSCFAFLQVA
jgi:hypothetical protein